MDETKKSPKATKKEPLLPFLWVFVLNVLVILLYVYEDQLPPIPGDTSRLLITFSILLTMVVLLRALFSLTDRRPNLYTVWELFALFELCFVLLQYAFSKAYQFFGLSSGQAITHDKWEALYFSIITWTTTGYGDLVPTVASRWVACSEALLGTLYNGLAIVSVVYQLNLMAKAKR